MGQPVGADSLRLFQGERDRHNKVATSLPPAESGPLAA
jgi:hypothetical protein